ncbi:MAG: HAD hydrolase family protein [Phycisphaeraceae bacterium]|nr:HAD hydrolase family protein [Phycisphaeraceae bacterium]
MSDPRRVRLLVLDVDGVLTDGSIYLDDQGNETKRFNVRDGLAIKVWQEAGLGIAIATARSGTAVRHRMRELGVATLIQGSMNKREALRSIEQRTGVPLNEMAYMGDDWPDLAPMAAVGYAMAVADAAPEVRNAAAWCSTRPGGRGAVREAIEHLLEARGLLEGMRAKFMLFEDKDDPGSSFS